MVFGIGFSIAPIGEQPDDLEAIRRAAAYQDCHRHLVTTVLDRLAKKHAARGVGLHWNSKHYGELLLRPL
jgi:hypothetical protein